MTETAVLHLIPVTGSSEENSLPNTIVLDHKKKIRVGGSDLTSDVVVNSSLAPRLLNETHATIVAEGDKHRLLDNNTRRGTYVNGNLVPPVGTLLEQNDVVGFGGPAKIVRDGQNLLNPYRYVYKISETRETRKRKRELDDDDATREIPFELREAATCAVCLEVWNQPHAVAGCGHVFCHDCVTKSFEKVGKCPTCNNVPVTTAKSELFTPCLVGKAILHRYVDPLLSPEERERRLKLERKIRATKVAKKREENENRKRIVCERFRQAMVGLETQLSAVRREFPEVPFPFGRVFVPLSADSDNRPPSHIPGETNVSWEARSVSEEEIAPCDTCQVIVPPRHLRFCRLCDVPGEKIKKHYHASVDCMLDAKADVRRFGLCLSEELNDQEKRIASVICDFLTR